MKLSSRSKIDRKKRVGVKVQAALEEPLHKLIAYQIDEDDSAPIRPARALLAPGPNFLATHAGTSRTLPCFQMIIGNPSRRSSARFFFVARRCACDATRASGDILLSGIGFRPLSRFFFISIDTRAYPSMDDNEVFCGAHIKRPFQSSLC